MNFALFLGCNIPARLTQYESSARAVLGKLGVGLVDIKEFNCCGYPLRNFDFKTFVLSSARNMALAEKRKLNILSLCKCCYGSLKKVDYLMKESASLRREINTILEKEDLAYEGNIEVKHFLSVLYHDIGLESIKEKMEKTFSGLKIAIQNGCHALRPSKIVQFDNPTAPLIFDQLVEVTGAESICWSAKPECCGAPLLGMNDDLSMNLTANKLIDAQQSGADFLCSACTYCQIQFDSVQKMIIAKGNGNVHIPSLLYSQLLGLCMGFDAKTVELAKNQIPVENIENYLKGNGKKGK
ncbi:MAG: CoB--CoM heterodisulfide reductase iron-sulfur subunit B family protein [Thermodesulfobacteriota bacterium]|nr:CoB--CoM heterodisulfide reductase iron-sulfur subunit B family protein [Thermodesulfobacteriota bacterium]